MAQRSYTFNLKAADFPLLYRDQPSTVLNTEGPTVVNNAGFPAIAYCHNVMSTIRGMKSISYITRIASKSSVVVSSDADVRIIYGNNKTRLYILFAGSSVYILKSMATSWLKLSFISPVVSNDITIGRARGISYIYFKKVGCYIYNESTDTLDEVILSGLDKTAILGITSSSGYLIAYNEDSISWGSVLDPIDFVPSTVTGAGSGFVGGIGGNIIFVLSNSLGLLIYSDTNIIAATYTGNVQYPFKLREVSNSKGGLTLDLSAYEANSTEQYVYTKAGLQSVTSRDAVTVLPEITDFLSGKVFEDFNETTLTFSEVNLSASMKKKLKLISSRYLVISYGISSFTHAIIYDVALKRLGKIKITHIDCFEYVDSQLEISKEAIAFLCAGGEIKTLEFSTGSSSSGVLLMGKVQYSKTRMTTLLEVSAENIEDSDVFNVYDLYSIDGKTLKSVQGQELDKEDKIRRYGFSICGKNHSILCIGDFDLNTLSIKYILNGRR